MQIEANKTYLTAAGYVVVIVKGEGNDCLLSTVETSPGVMFNKKNIHESNAGYTGRNKYLGWYYTVGGQCTSVNNEWQGKLRINEELPFSLPTLPTGYKWKGDFPQYRVPVLEEKFLGQTAVGSLDGSVVKCCKHWLGVSVGEKRLIVELMNTAPQIEPVASPQKYRDIDPLVDTPEDHDEFFDNSSDKWVVRNSVNCIKNDSFMRSGTKYRRPITSPVPDGMVEVTHLPDYLVKRNGDGYLSALKYFIYASSLHNNKEFSVQWFLDIHPTDYKLYATQENYKEWIASQEKKADESRAKLLGEMRNTTVKINGEEIKGAKVSDPVTTFASTTGLVIPTNNDQVWSTLTPKSPIVQSGIGRRAFNYWLGDPIKTITKEVKAALPYIVLGGSAWGITYSVFHIEEIKDLYNKHVPSVSISIDAPEILSK